MLCYREANGVTTKTRHYLFPLFIASSINLCILRIISPGLACRAIAKNFVNEFPTNKRISLRSRRIRLFVSPFVDKTAWLSINALSSTKIALVPRIGILVIGIWDFRQRRFPSTYKSSESSPPGWRASLRAITNSQIIGQCRS